MHGALPLRRQPAAGSPSVPVDGRLRAGLRRPDRASRRARVPAVPAPGLDRTRPAPRRPGRRSTPTGSRSVRPASPPSTPRSPRSAKPTPTASRSPCASSARRRARRSAPARSPGAPTTGAPSSIHLPQLDAEPLAAGAPVADGGDVRLRQRGGAGRRGRLDLGVGVDRRTACLARRGRADRRGRRAAPPPCARAPAVRVGSRGLDRLAAGDARADAARPPRRRRPARPVRVLRRRAAAGAGPPGPDGAIPPNVTTDYEEGATMHIGARPAAREPVLDVRLARPTRLVSRSGTLHPDAPADWHTIPRYDSLAAALAAVSASWQAIPATDAGDVSEVVQFEDSATYPGRGAGLAGGARERRRARTAVADDPGGRARAPDGPRRSRPGLGDAGAGRRVRSADAARHRPRRRAAGPGMTLPPAERGRARALQRPARREPARVRRRCRPAPR